MVASRSGSGRWLRKYKTFFLIGLVILIFQVFLVAHFLELKSTTNDWQPQNELVRVPQIAEVIPKKNVNANTSVLRLEELSFKPECEITGKEAVSAIHRAHSQECKKLIANVTCKALAGTLYPEKLPGNCPNDGRIMGKALGCFKDENNYRLLSGYFGINKRSNSPDYCTQLCLQSGFEYAGVQYSNECFCGNDEPPSTSKLPDSSCNMKCPGDFHSTCGGYYTINIYQTGIKKFAAQIANTDSPIDEESVKIVFLLTLNGRALRQVKRLLKILYHQNHYYYIHVDVREDYLFRELLSLETRFPNIRLTRRRFATIWGGASLLEMLLSCMSELLDMSAWKWDFVLNLSESDYPVKMVSSLERFLGANKNRNFVKSHGRDTQKFLQKQGLDKTFVECDMRMWRIADRQLPHGLQMDGGSDWIALSRKFVSYVAATPPDALIVGLKQVFKYTLLPAESFFHTALRNSYFCDSYVDNNLHVTNWKRKLGCKCQYKHVVDWCGCSPNDFRPDDWTRVQSTVSRQLYFARKFEPIVNQAVVLKLELWLFGLEKPSHSVRNLHSYWQTIYHHLDLSPRIDDGLKTAITSVGRVWRQNVSNGTCRLTIERIKTATSFHSKDAYKYTLVHFAASADSSLVEMEVAFRPINMTYLVTHALTKRLEELIVSSDFDQKEQLSRNFPRILSPHSDPVLIYRFSGGDNSVTHNISCLWTDSTGALVDITDISIDENSVIGHSKPNLKQPHLPGAWSVKLILQSILLAEVTFVILPLEFYFGNPLVPKQAQTMHNNQLPKIANENYDRFLKTSFDESILKAVSSANAKRTGLDLQYWIDSLFRKFYVIEKMCVVQKGMMDVCGVRMEACFKSGWSSFAPDPKSEIGDINRSTGGFDIW